MVRVRFFCMFYFSFLSGKQNLFLQKEGGWGGEEVLS